MQKLTDRDKEATIRAVAAVVQGRTQQPVSDIEGQLYERYTGLSSSQKMNFWNDVSAITRLDQQQMYKYFINTWSKSVFDEFSPQMRRFVTTECTAAFVYYSQQKPGRKQLISQVWERVKRQIARYNLHQGQVYAFVHHAYTKLLNSADQVDYAAFLFHELPIPQEPRGLAMHLREVRAAEEEIRAAYRQLEAEALKADDSLNILQQYIMNESVSCRDDFGIVVGILGSMV